MKHGRGGHYHSLNHISRKLAEEHDVKIVSVGPATGDVLEDNPYFYGHIFFDGISFISFRNRILALDRELKPDIFHCFDAPIYNVLRLFISSRRKKIVVNLCGGPNPIEFAHVKNLVLFSLENKEWFESQRKFDDTNIHLIPNRVSAVQLDDVPNEYVKDNQYFNIVRVCRILETYKKSVEDTIELVLFLKKSGIHNVRLYVIGTVEDGRVFSELRRKASSLKDDVVFVTDDKYTKEASRMLYLADAVIGVGRSAMEAASLGIPLLSINANGNHPVLLDETNIMDAFRTNFSQRNVFSQYNEENNLRKITRLISDPAYLKKQREFSQVFFKKYFAIETAAAAYTTVYKSSMYSKRFLLADIKIIAKMFRRYYFYTNQLLSNK